MFDMKMSEKERVAKYREENKRATELATRKSNFKRTQLLASGTPEAAKLREKAAARKRLQREREKQKMREKEEEEVRENVVLIKESKRRLSAPAHNDDMESDVE